jgi:hypothetical protein
MGGEQERAERERHPEERAERERHPEAMSQLGGNVNARAY